jgi:hypothetical protein
VYGLNVCHTGPLCEFGQTKPGTAYTDKAYVVSAHGVDLLDFIAECRCLVDHKLEEVVRRRFAGEELELLVDGSTPKDHDEHRNLVAESVRRYGNYLRVARTMMAPMGSSPVARLVSTRSEAWPQTQTPPQLATTRRCQHTCDIVSNI